MRVIIFRGYQDALEKFVYGSYVYHPKFIDGKLTEHWIMREDGFKYAIENPDTIGQYTGLEDMDGKDIYEGDILEDEEHMLWEVCWNKEEASFKLVNLEMPGAMIITQTKNMGMKGNRYENPELLEVE